MPKNKKKLKAGKAPKKAGKPVRKPVEKVVARKKPKPKPRRKVEKPKPAGGEIYLNQVLEAAKAKPDPKAGPGDAKDPMISFTPEMRQRMQSMGRRTGIDAFHNTFNRLTVANTDSAFALPAGGDYKFAVPDAKKIEGLRKARIAGSLRIQAARLEGVDELTIQASLRMEASNITTLRPFFHSPGNAQDAYQLPKSYVEQIRWSRIMYNLNPWIASVTELKAFYAVSKFKISTPEPFVTAFYEQNAFNKNFNLYSFMRRINLSKKKFGEAIMWGTKRQDGVWPQTGQPRWVWSNFILLEPELVEIKKEVMGDPLPKYFLRPNRDFEELVKRLEQNDPSVAHLQGTIAPAIITKIKSRELIPLDPTTISSIQVLTDASAERGTPPYQRLFVNFTFEDFVRLALMAQAQRYHYPIELWTIGNAEKNIWPQIGQLEAFRDMIEDAIMSPPFTLFFPDIVKYQALGVEGALIDPKENMLYAQKQYLIGLGVSEDMILGQALALDTAIPIPTGWTTMGELKVGDEIFSRDGSITHVVAKSDVWNARPTYSVKLDGAAYNLVADENHQWVAGSWKSKHISWNNQTRKQKVTNFFVESIKKTSEFFGDLNKGENGRKWSIPIAGSLDLTPADLPIPPYALGAWLGDGASDAVGGYYGQESDVEVIDNIRADGFEVRRQKGGKYSWYIKNILGPFRAQGLAGNKHIPAKYLRASYSQRLALMQGLMDTDGSVTAKTRDCDFSNTNYGLMLSVRELALTLGFKPGPVVPDGHSGRKDAYKVKGKNGKIYTHDNDAPCYRMRFVLGLGQPVPFRLARKAERCGAHNFPGRSGVYGNRRSIESVDRVASVPTVCIQISHPSGTFLAGRDFVVTHNSSVFGSNETAGNQVFIRMVQTDRDDLEEWARWNFFEPLAQWNNLKIEKNGQLVPIIPDLEWEKTLDFKAQEDERKNLTTALDKGLVDPETWIQAVLNRSPEEIAVKIRKAVGGVFDAGKLGGAARDAILSGNGKPEPRLAAPGGGGTAPEAGEVVPEETGGGDAGGPPPSKTAEPAAPEAGGGGAPAASPGAGAETAGAGQG